MDVKGASGSGRARTPKHALCRRDASLSTPKATGKARKARKASRSPLLASGSSRGRFCPGHVRSLGLAANYLLSEGLSFSYRMRGCICGLSFFLSPSLFPFLILTLVHFIVLLWDYSRLRASFHSCNVRLSFMILFF